MSRDKAKGERVGVNVTLPADVHHAVKVACAVERLTLEEAITAAVRFWTASKDWAAKAKAARS